MEQLEDKGKNHEHRSPMGPLKSLGALGKYPLFPPLPTRWACLDIVQYLTLTVYRSQGVMHTS